MTISLIHTKNLPIFSQLEVEESLLRNDSRNWCLINEGCSPSIVMGISNKPEQLLHLNKIRKNPIPIIKRFTGGGTVFVDENTVFITFIFSKESLAIKPYPEPIMRWMESFYTNVFKHKDFLLKENDFVIKEKKCGGNAQYIQKNRWLHHTSFLWDYSEKHMDYLSTPDKKPKYRNNRSHKEFLCCLKHFYSSKDEWIKRFTNNLNNYFSVNKTSIEEVKKNIPFSNKNSSYIV